MIEPATASVAVADVRILLVEDDAGDALLVRASLGEAGIPDDAIAWRRTLAEADTDTLAQLVGAGTPACILLDLGLPDATGYDGVVKMVGAAPQVPVIVLTGRQERDGIEALAAGAQDYLIKDIISAEMLERSIRYAIERKRAQAAQQQLRDITVSAAEQGRLERGLLPTPLLRSDHVSVSTYYRPGRDDAVLGGDFYDIVETPDGRVRAIIGDVMGHGANEAALGVHLRVAWRTLLLAGVADDQILPTMAMLLRSEGDQIARYVTACDVTIRGDVLSVRLAGHPAPIVCTSYGCHYLQAVVGLPLGVAAAPKHSEPWPQTDVPLDAGASLVMYTDGLLDAFFDMSDDGIGVPQLVAAVDDCQRAGGPPAAWVPALLTGAPRDSIDDTAAVVLTLTDDE